MRLALSAALLVALPAPASPATVICWGDVIAADHPAVQMIERIARRVADATQGRITIQAYPASQLGSSKDQIEAVALGSQQMVTEGAANFGQ